MSARFDLQPLPYDGKLHAFEALMPTWGGDDSDEPQFVYDETGEHRAAKRLSDWSATLPGLGLEPQPMTDAEAQNLAWQVEIQSRIDRDYVHAEAAHAAEWGDLYGACTALGADPSAAGKLLQDDGLVPVLSTGQRAKSARQPRSGSFRNARRDAERKAAAEQAGAFLVGSPESRMARLREAVGTSARLLNVPRMGFRPEEVLMLTATYADPKGWRPNHVKELMRHVRRWLDRRGMKARYVWVCEVQDGKRSDGVGRGAPHYHILLWVPVGVRLPMPDKQGWWSHGSTRIEVAKSGLAYVLSYLKKSDSKSFDRLPDGCRVYSVGGLEHAQRRARRWLRLPSFVQANSSLRDDWRRAEVGTGGGWVAPDGTRWPSEFQTVMVCGARALTRVRTHPRDIEASGPFEWIKDRDLAKA